MDTTKLFPVLLAVIKNPKVIIAFAVVLLYWSFVSFVLYYKKRPPRPKVQKKPAAVSAAPAEGAAAPAEGEAAAAEAPAAE